MMQPTLRQSSASTWTWLAAILLLMAVALFVRCYRLALPVLSVDEAFSWRLAQYAPADLIRRTAADVHPPLYYLLLKVWLAVAGDSPGSLRGFSVLWSVLTIPLLYLVCREILVEGEPGQECAALGWRGGAFFSAALLTFHLAQVTPLAPPECTFWEYFWQV